MESADQSRSTSPIRNRKARIRELIEQRKPRAALREWNRLQHLRPDSQLGRQELLGLARGLRRIGLWQEGVALMEEYVVRFGGEADNIRVQAAAILLQRLNRPKAALRMLEPVDLGNASRVRRERCRQLVAAARELIDSGVIELQGNAFPAASASPPLNVGVESVR